MKTMQMETARIMGSIGDFFSGLFSSSFGDSREFIVATCSIIGLILITLTRYVDSMELIGKRAYPIFHGIAGLTIFLLPILLVKADKVKSQFIWVTVGGTLIGLGGIALGFLTAGKQLLFFSPEFVLMILAPLLFLMTLCYMYGFTKGDK